MFESWVWKMTNQWVVCKIGGFVRWLISDVGMQVIWGEGGRVRLLWDFAGFAFEYDPGIQAPGSSIQFVLAFMNFTQGVGINQYVPVFILILLFIFAVTSAEIHKCWWGGCFLYSIFQDLPWTLNIEVDKRAMLTTGQNTSPPPLLPRIALKIGNSCWSPAALTLPHCFLLAETGEMEGKGCQEECWRTRQGNRVRSRLRMKLSCLLDTGGHSHWSGLAAQAAIGGFSRWLAGPDEAGVHSGVKGQILRHLLMTIHHQHNVLLLDDAFYLVLAAGRLDKISGIYRDFLGKGWGMSTGEGGGGDILTILRLKSWKWGLSSADI